MSVYRETFFPKLLENDLSNYQNPDLIRAFDSYFYESFITNTGFLKGNNKEHNTYLLYSIFGELPKHQKYKRIKNFKETQIKQEKFDKFCEKFLIKNGFDQSKHIPLFFHYHQGMFFSSFKNFIFITNEHTYSQYDGEGVVKIQTSLFFRNLLVKRSFGIGEMSFSYSEDGIHLTSIESDWIMSTMNQVAKFLTNISQNYNSYITFNNEITWTSLEEEDS